MELIAAAAFDSAFNTFYQFFDSFAFLVLASLGLAVIFGMMGIINLAHGEFIMIGAYMTAALTHAGVPFFPVAILVAAAVVGVYGLVVERVVVRYFYRRPLDSVVATWGLGLMMSQGTLILLGPTFEGIATPFGSLAVGPSTFSVYRIVLGLSAIVLLAALYSVFMYTKFGLRARATMQNPEVAQSLGVNTPRIYAFTFMIGSALAGVTGGLYAPTTTIVPHFGTGFTLEAFATVIVGGANPLTGTLLSAGVLGFIFSVLSSVWSTFIGRVGLLVATIIVIRFLPLGLSGLVARRMRAGV